MNNGMNPWIDWLHCVVGPAATQKVIMEHLTQYDLDQWHDYGNITDNVYNLCNYLAGKGLVLRIVYKTGCDTPDVYAE